MTIRPKPPPTQEVPLYRREDYLKRLLFDVLPYLRDYMQLHPQVPKALLYEIEAVLKEG